MWASYDWKLSRVEKYEYKIKENIK